MALGRVLSLGWVWASKEGTARQKKRQEVRVSYNKIKQKVTVGSFRMALLLYWSEWAERSSQTLSRWTARDKTKSRTHRDYTFYFLSPTSLSATLKYPPALRLRPRTSKLLRTTTNPFDANPLTPTEVNIHVFLSDYKARQHTVSFSTEYNKIVHNPSYG